MGIQVYQTEESQSQGTQELIWNAEGYPGGFYYYKLQIGRLMTSGKLIKI
jgi:hypothetical protein